MKRTRHTPEQIVRKMCEADRLLAQTNGATVVLIYFWGESLFW